MSCRICLEEGGTFVHPCSCKGEVGNVHPACLTRWVEESKHDYCEICHSKYNMKDRLACISEGSVVGSALVTWVVTILPIQNLHLLSWVSHA